MRDILVEQIETETQKLAKKELPFIIDALDIIAGHNSDQNGELAKETSENISEIMKEGRIEEPKFVGMVVHQLLKSARTYTEDFMEHMIELSSGMFLQSHFSLKRISTGVCYKTRIGCGYKTNHSKIPRTLQKDIFAEMTYKTNHLKSERE